MELFEEFGVILEHRRDDPTEGFVVLDLGVLPVGVLFRVFECLILGHFLRYLALDAAQCPGGVGIVACELLIELVEDVRKAVEFGFGFASAAGSRYGLYLGIRVRQGDGQRRLLLGPVAEGVP